MWLCQLCLRTPVVLHHHWHTDMSAYSYDKKGRVQRLNRREQSLTFFLIQNVGCVKKGPQEKFPS